MSGLSPEVFRELVARLTQNLSAKKLRGNVLFRSGSMATFCLKGNLDGVKVRLDLNPIEALLELTGFTAPCNFQFDIGNSDVLLQRGLIDVTTQTGCIFPLWSTVVEEHINCLVRQFGSSWERWEPIANAFITNGGVLSVSTKQCVAALPDLKSMDLLTVTRNLVLSVSSPPFALQRPTGPLTRYTDSPGITIEDSVIPCILRPLIPFAKEWCISDEEEVLKYARKVGRAKTHEFVAMFSAHAAAINEFCDYRSAGVVPHEVTSFQIAGHAFALLQLK